MYIDNLSYHFLLDHLDYGKSIFRVMDIHEGFPKWKGKAWELADKIAKKANLTAYSAICRLTFPMMGIDWYISML